MDETDKTDKARMRERPGFSHSGLKRLGLGISGPHGEAWFRADKTIELIGEAVSLGITRFDTGPLYGRAEERLGAAIRLLAPGDRARLSVSTKVGNFLDAEGERRRDFSDDAIKRLVDQSLGRLGLDTLDVLYLHGPNEHELVSSLDMIMRLRDEGVIRKTGVCSEGSHLARAAGLEGVDVLMGTYNFLDRRHAALFEEASSAGKEITAIAPLAQGLYRRGFYLPRSLADGWYLARALVKNRDRLGAARDLDWLHEVDGWDAPSLALAFVLAKPAVDCAMMTTTRTRHLKANIAAARRDLPHDLMMRLDAISC